MSIKNFIPTLWAEEYIRAAETAHKFVADCVRKYEGQLKKMGDEVVIPSLGDMTIRDINIKDKHQKLEAPERLDSTAIKVKADQISYFNFMVDDIDAAQAKGSLLDEAQRRSAYLMADKHDKYVAKLSASSEAPKLWDAPKKVVEGKPASDDEVNVLRMIDLCAQRLYENDVPDSATIVAIIPPRLRTLIKSEYLDKITDNVAVVKNGLVGKYGNVLLRVSNNVYSTGEGASIQDKIMVHTTDAIAFVEQICEVEAYRPEDYFGDAVKGYSLYGGKIIRPKNLVVADITY